MAKRRSGFKMFECNHKFGCGKEFKSVYVIHIGKNLCEECYKKSNGKVL